MRKYKILNYLLSFTAVILSVLLISNFSAKNYVVSTGKLVGFYVISIVLVSFVCTFFHELGHLIGAKSVGFSVITFCVWFFKFYKVKNKTKFSFAFPEDSGYTESCPKDTINLEKKFKKTIVFALIFSIIPVFFCLPAFIFDNLPFFLFTFFSTFLPVAIYGVLNNFIPMSENGVRNDGEVLRGLKILDDETKVTISLLKIQAELYQGKTPSDINEEFLFDLPQLPEDSVNFTALTLYRYYFYLDKNDLENAKKQLERLNSLTKYMSKIYKAHVGAQRLFYYSFFEKDENIADDLTYENEKYLNTVNDSVNIRAKLAYICFIKGDKDSFESFYKMGKKVAKRQNLTGVKLFELKLLDAIKNKVE